MTKALTRMGWGLLLSLVFLPLQGATLTNVIQNVSLQLTVYQQGPTNTQGTKITTKPVQYTTKSFIQAIQAVSGQTFSPDARLVRSTIFSNITVNNFSSNNLAVVPPASNFYVFIGATNVGEEVFTADGGSAVLSNNTFVSGFSGSITLTTNLVVNATNSSVAVTFITNAGYETTFIPATNSVGLLTNIAVVSQQSGISNVSQSVFTNVTSTMAIMYGRENNFYPVSNYIVLGTNSPEIVTETGVGLYTNNGATPALNSQTAYSISNLTVNYFAPNGTNSLSLNLQGFVKQSLKVDVFSKHGRSVVFADIHGANSSWTVLGMGYTGGVFSSNGPGTAVTNIVAGNPVTGFLSNTVPIVAEGTINMTFLENLAQ
jgi:hypothetical protein